MTNKKIDYILSTMTMISGRTSLNPLEFEAQFGYSWNFKSHETVNNMRNANKFWKYVYQLYIEDRLDKLYLDTSIPRIKETIKDIILYKKFDVINFR